MFFEKIPRFENSLFFKNFLYYETSMIFKIFFKIPFLKTQLFVNSKKNPNIVLSL